MTKIEICYNRYIADSSVITKINGKENNYGKDSFMSISFGMDKWFDSFFEKTQKLGKSPYEIFFQGTEADYNNFETYRKNNLQEDKKRKFFPDPIIRVKTNKLSHKERVSHLKEFVEKIHKNPYGIEDFCTKKDFDRFNTKINSEQAIAIIATMSSGKSTLINALLHRDLMPSANSSTTATITKIINCDIPEPICYVIENGKEKKIEEPITVETMRKYHPSEEDVKNSKATVPDLIRIEMKIPSLESNNINLTLIDTPGPNTVTTPKHKKILFDLLRNNDGNEPLILYVIDLTKDAVEDEKKLFDEILGVIKDQNEKNKQNRFLFVLNRTDEIKESENETVKGKLETWEKRLKERGIKTPVLLPISALYAQYFGYPNELVAREDKKKRKTWLPDEDVPERHENFSELAQLSPANKKKLDDMIKSTESKSSDAELKYALIATGLPALELAIQEYLDDYALPTKIANAVSDIQKQIDDKYDENKLLSQIKEDENKREKVINDLKAISKKLSSGDKAKKLIEEIDKLEVPDTVRQIFISARERVVKKFSSEVKKTDEVTIDISDAEKQLKQVERLFMTLSANISSQLESVIVESIDKNIKDLKCEWENYVTDIINSSVEIDSSLNIKPMFSKVSANLSNKLDDYKGERHYKYKNPERDGWGFFKFWEPWWIKGTTKFVKWSELYEKEIQPRVVEFIGLINSVRNEEENRVKELKETFKSEVKELNKEMKKIIATQEDLIQNKEVLNKNIETSKNQIEWIKEIRKELQEIIQI